jgi:hypothetical protein
VPWRVCTDCAQISIGANHCELAQRIAHYNFQPLARASKFSNPQILKLNLEPETPWPLLLITSAKKHRFCLRCSAIKNLPLVFQILEQ